tara:strand:- start:1274 stop:2203 length:930 start_codon:yes stop_codon:yes gene_type:complete
MKTAIAYFCYNRLNHTKKSLDATLRYKSKLPCYIFSDYWVRKEKKNVISVRHYIEMVCSEKSIFIIHRNKNYGLAKSIITGVNHVFNNGYDSIIVLEDDCIPDANFFDFMLKALKFYETNDKVMHISGFGLPIKRSIKKEYYFSPYPCSWGWATWRKTWERCNFEDHNFYKKVLFQQQTKTFFDWSGKSFSNFLYLQVEKKIDSWLIRWYAYIFKNKGLCLWSSNTKIKNIGFDRTGVHKAYFDRYNQKKNSQIKKVNFNNDLSLDLKLLNHFSQFFPGPNVVSKLRALLYTMTGIIFTRIQDMRDYYK